MAAGTPNRFKPGGFRGVRKPPTTEEWEEFSDFEKDQKRGEEWMNRVYGWNINAGNDNLPSYRWIPDKLLGKGIAVFKKGCSANNGNTFYQKIVVKQASSPEAKARLQNGASIVDRVREHNRWDADHIILPFRAYEEDAGTGADDTFDPVYVHESTSDTVGRTYTTYYEEGNLHQWLENNFGEQYPSENDLWSVMECMARICMRLEHGHSREADHELREKYRSVVHLDIRPESIFCEKDDRPRDGQHNNRTRFILGKFEKAAVVPSDPMDKIWMFSIRGRADPKWATPEQKYPHMEGRSIGTPCNIFGIGALLYYMITGRELGDSAWNIGISDSPTGQGLKLYFGADLITEPIAKQQEYSKTLIRTILQCLSYHPRDRIDAKGLRELSAKALKLVDRQLMEDEVRYKPGDPATILEPQEELQPNDYTPSDLSLKTYKPPADQPDTLRARAEKWLNRFFLFPDSAKGQQSRENQRLEYEKQVEIQRQAEAAEAVRKQLLAEIEADEAEEMRLQIKQEEEEDRKVAEQRAKKRTDLAAEMARRRAAAIGEGGQQTLLPQPVRKRDRSPEIVEERSRKRARSASPVRPNTPDTAAAQEGGAEPMDVDSNKYKNIPPPGDTDAAQEVGAEPMDVDSNKDKNIPSPGDTDKEKEKEEKEKEKKEKEKKEKEKKEKEKEEKEKEKKEKEKKEKEKKEKEKEKKEKEEKAKIDEANRQQEYREDLAWRQDFAKRENERKKREQKQQWTSEIPVRKDERRNPRLDPHLAINPDEEIEYKGSRYSVKDLWMLKEPFPWKDFAWWDGSLYEKDDLPYVAEKYYEDLKEEGIELVAHSGSNEETRLELRNVSRMNRLFDEKEREKEREENGHRGLINPPVGGAARGMNDNYGSPSTRKPREPAPTFDEAVADYWRTYGKMGAKDDDDEDANDSVREVAAPPANARSHVAPRTPSRYITASPAPKASPKASPAPKASSARTTAWFCPYCNEKDGGYAKKGSCATHISNKHKKKRGKPQATAFVPKRATPNAYAPPARYFNPYRYDEA